MSLNLTAKSAKNQDGLTTNRASRVFAGSSSPLETSVFQRFKTTGRSSLQSSLHKGGKASGRSTDPVGTNYMNLGWRREAPGWIGYEQKGKRNVRDVWKFTTNGSVCGDSTIKVSGLAKSVQLTVSAPGLQDTSKNGDFSLTGQLPRGTYYVTIDWLGGETSYKLSIKNA
jgi:hypothetical protein